MRLLEAFLRRLQRHPDAEGFVVRGGVRVGQLVPGARRTASDLDLVCGLPFDPPAIERGIREVLAVDVGDPVRFDDALHVEVDWNPTAPGLRAVVSVDALPLSVDLRFGLPLWLPPASTPSGWGARAETLVARKLRVVAELGRARWRPKDLADIALLLEGASIEAAALDTAIEAAFDGRMGEVREILSHPAWWSGARWATGSSADLSATVGTVRRHLARFAG